MFIVLCAGRVDDAVLGWARNTSAAAAAVTLGRRLADAEKPTSLVNQQLVIRLQAVYS